MRDQDRSEKQNVIKDFNGWDRRYLQTKQLWTRRPDSKLMQYFDLVKMGEVLDLGIGEGRNSLPFLL